ncbi:MAG: hypothetical protein IKW30_00425 [Lachnospiraceae bacterium]|nr:hypothetical protein [Lachnospiraceae bacterium]
MRFRYLKYVFLSVAIISGLLFTACSNKTETVDEVADIPEEIVEEHEHIYTEEVTMEAACENDGEKTFTCECGDTYTEVITATGHSYEEVADSAVAATCDTDGKDADTKCSVCENVVEGAVITATGHQFGEYVYNNNASTAADGTETATCSVCGGTDTRTKAGTKIEVVYDGYDEFGNGYVMGDDGYKHFDAKCPYATYQANWTNNSEVYFYGIKGSPSISQSLKQEMAVKNGIPYDDRIKTDYNYLGYYNGQLVFSCRIYIG